ncbi:hypothetical protein I2900191A2_23850 [Intestinibacter bartlettii]|uniref:hypothetical protein n=1 Tax=Intestinibacter bartlettii TaxID=261299 RepID=UPI0034B3CAA9
MDTKIIKNKMREYEINAINEKYEKFDEQKLQKILNSIKDEEIMNYVINNVYFLIELMEENCYLNGDIINMFIYINRNSKFRNPINAEYAQALVDEINDKGYLIYERYAFYNDRKYIEELLEGLDIKEGEVAFCLESGKKLYSCYFE